jgi:hypothetical protein
VAKDQLRSYQFFLISAQTDIIPNAKNNIASIQLLLRNASINAIPKNNMKTARFVNFITLIFLFFFIDDLRNVICYCSTLSFCFSLFSISTVLLNNSIVISGVAPMHKIPNFPYCDKAPII